MVNIYEEKFSYSWYCPSILCCQPVSHDNEKHSCFPSSALVQENSDVSGSFIPGFLNHSHFLFSFFSMQTAALTQSLLIGLRTSKILPWLDLCLVVWTACWVLSTGAENTVPNWLCNVSSWSTWCLSCCTSRTNACSCQQFWAAFEATLNPKMEWTIVENVSGMAPLRTGQFEWVSEWVESDGVSSYFTY